MKNTNFLNDQNLFLLMGLKARSIGYIFLALVTIFSLTLFIGCNEDKVATEEAVVANSKVHVAFAGGGWRAHTGHSAWIMTTLNNGKRSLKEAFKNVGTISSNSGGSWFNTMLNYSGDFVRDIESRTAKKDWAKTGWLGVQQKIFDGAGCQQYHEEDFLACVVEATLPSIDDDFYWNLVVKDIVFKDYTVDQPLSGTRQDWAKDKSLLLASTMLTSSVVTNDQDTDEQYYQACLSPNNAKTNGQQGGYCSPRLNTDVTPVTFSSIPTGLGLTAPPFLTAAGVNSPHFNLEYSQNPFLSPTTATATIQNPLNHGQIPVMIAAAASSAAGGFIASETVNRRWQPNKNLDSLWRESYLGEDEALSFQLNNHTAQFVDASDFSLQQLADSIVVRLADGGPVDNSGVAQLVSFLQLNKQADGFQINAFDNVQAGIQPGGTGALVGTDIAYLFGKGLSNGNQFCSGLKGKGICINVPDLQIFELEALTSTPALMTKSSASGEIVYTIYKVTTVDNPILGVTAGTTGYLHAWSCIWPSADTFPENKTLDGDFKAYENMLNFITSSFAEQNNEGLKHLESALGL